MLSRGPTLGRLSRPSSSATTLAVLADPHVSPDGEGTWKVYHRTGDRLRTAVAEINRLGVDGVVFAGDLTRDGRDSEFAYISELLADLQVPYLAVPGNHDVPKEMKEHETPRISVFAERFGGSGSGGSSGGRSGGDEFPLVRKFGDVSVVGLNSAANQGELGGTHDGEISDDQLAWLGETLPELDNTVVTMHHPLVSNAGQIGGYRVDSVHSPLRNADEVSEVLSRHGVDLVFTGHNHWFGLGQRDGVRDVAVPAVCSLPQAYLLVTIEPQGTSLTVVPLADKFGFEEAYQYALTGGARSRSIAENVSDGYVDSFPLIDEREPEFVRDPRPEPAQLERLHH